MPNIHCKICDESWDVYGLSHGDVKAWEADMIYAGIGCPSCEGVKGNSNYKPKEWKVTICECAECGDNIDVYTDDIFYDGSRKVIYDNLGIIDIELDKIRYAESFKWKFIDNELICNSCFDECYFICTDCNCIESREDSYYINEYKLVCSNCYQSYSFCSACEEYFSEDETTFFGDKIYCDYCLKLITFECEICNERIFNEDVIYGPNEEKCCSEHCADSCKGTNNGRK